MSRVGSFVKGSLILAISNIFLKAIGFILLPFYTRCLTPDLLGVNDTIVNFTALFFAMLMMALDSAFGAFYFDEDSDLYRNRVFGTVRTVLALASSAAFLAMFFSPALSLLIFGAPEYAAAICFSLAGVALNLWHVPFALRVRMQNRMGLFAAVGVISSVLMTLSNILLLAVFNAGYYALILGTLVSHAVQLLLYLAFTGPPVKFRVFDVGLLRAMLRYSLPLLPITLANWVITLSDRYVLLFFGYSKADVGLYGAASRFVAILSVLTGAVFTAYPAFAFKAKREDEGRKDFPRVLNVFFVLLSFVCLFISVFGREIIRLMTAAEYHDAYRLLPELMFAQLAYGLSVLVGYGMAFAKKSVFSSLSVWAGALVNVAANIALVPRFGLSAAVATTLASCCVMLVLNYVFAQRLYPCRYEAGRIVPVFAGLYAVSALARDLSFAPKTALWAAAMAALIYVFRESVFELLERLRRQRV